jgi:hypothetical protein
MEVACLVETRQIRYILPMTVRTIYCRACGLNLPVEAFRQSRVGPGTKRDQCKKCNSRYSRQWNISNPDRVAKTALRNAEKQLLAVTAWRKNNQQYFTKYMRVWRERNRAAVNESANHSTIKNSAKIALRGSQVPAWADREAIRAIYAEACRLTQETGIPHHVDHIIPLKGKNVSGLHVENNLQVLPALENMKKRNKFEEARHYKHLL